MKQVIHIFGAAGSGTSTLAAAGYETGGVEMRSKAMHDAWSRKLSCPVLVLDGTQPVESPVDAVLSALQRKEEPNVRQI